uniref:TMV resistance protein N n=1 Tax=Rhizophora mucronata TaxID=61149 RepID=A0A2P2MUK5_RHIMU
MVLGTNAIEGILLDMSGSNNRFCVDLTAFSNIDQVKLIQFLFCQTSGDILGDLQKFPKRWKGKELSIFFNIRTMF